MAIKTIIVVGNPVIKEYTCNAAITPGMLCERMSTGKMRAHATGGGCAARIFAVEDDHQGKSITDAYTAANQGQFVTCNGGDEVYALLANGETAVVGSFLESQGDGNLRVVDTDASAGDIIPHSIVGQALEAVDMSGSSGEDPTGRIRIEVL